MRVFANPEALAVELADYVAAGLRARIECDGHAALALSGGTTPLRFFGALSLVDLPWSDVTITLVDDRWVPESSPRSNAALVRKHLLKNYAGAAHFLPLLTGAASPEAGRHAVNEALAALPLPFAVVVLGMGTDGHTASFFPGGDKLSEALAPIDGTLVETMRAEAAVEARMTLTLPVIMAAEHVALHIEGIAKRDVLQNLNPAMPVSAVLARQPAPDIFWSP